MSLGQVAGIAKQGEKQGLPPGGPYGGAWFPSLGDRNNKNASAY